MPLYARTIVDWMHPLFAEAGFAFVAAAPFMPTGEYLLRFESAHHAALVTAGFGLTRTLRGVDAPHHTAHAEFCLYGPRDASFEQGMAQALKTVADAARTTLAPDGIIDGDTIASGHPAGWRFFLAPVDVLELSSDRPVAIRLVVPITADEAASFGTGTDHWHWFDSLQRFVSSLTALWQAYFHSRGRD